MNEIKSIETMMVNSMGCSYNMDTGKIALSVRILSIFDVEQVIEIRYLHALTPSVISHCTAHRAAIAGVMMAVVLMIGAGEADTTLANAESLPDKMATLVDSTASNVSPEASAGVASIVNTQVSLGSLFGKGDALPVYCV
ncbi:MAG: hypothetical protein ACYC4K_09015 [Thiobacillus sp.]